MHLLLRRYAQTHVRAYHALQTAAAATSGCTISDTVDRADPAFVSSHKRTAELAALLRANVGAVASGTPATAAARRRHVEERGRMLARDRVEALLDAGSPFLELSQLAAHGLYADGGEDVPAGGIVTGVGCVHGVPAMVVANDVTVKGGTYYPITVKKHLRAQEIASRLRLPCVYLADSGGANLPRQADVFPDREHFGRIFHNMATMSASGVPQLAVVMGSCTAGGAYVPAMADENVIVANQGTVFLAGPPLVKAATGEDVSAEDLGGGLMHSQISGVTDHLASCDKDAIRKAREILLRLAAKRDQPKLTLRSGATLPFVGRDDPTEIYGLVSEGMRGGPGVRPFDVRQVVARIVDNSELHEFKREYGTTLVCGTARIGGYEVGIIANNGILFSEAALKGAHFIQLCEANRTPLLFLQNIAGFMVGSDAERGGIAKNGAKLVNAVATSTSIAKFTIIIGGSYGAGNYGMCGRAYSPELLFMWPNARIGVMGGEQAAEVLVRVRKDASARRRKSQPTKSEPLETAANSESEESFRTKMAEKYDLEARPEYSTARLWDDGVIDPVQTRQIMIFALALADRNNRIRQQATGQRGQYGIFRM